MSRFVVELPDSAAATLGVDPAHVAEGLRLAAAMKLYELGRLSSGAAAEFAGLPLPLFLQRMGEFGIPVFNQSADELAEELRNA